MKLPVLSTLLIALCISFMAQAINVGEVTSMMPSDAKNLSKEIANTTDMARFVSVNIERLSSPMATGIVIPMESRSELLSTPASLILPGGSKDNFRFFYKGPEDDKERYYRLSWTDEPVAEYDALKNKKIGQATTSAIISTILVVAPRKEKFDFTRQNDTVFNTGNTSFRVISYGPCREKNSDNGKGCRERYYVMPGMNVKIKYTNLYSNKTRIGIWHDGRYINVE